MNITPSSATPLACAAIVLSLLYAIFAMGQLLSGRLDNHQTWGVQIPQTVTLSGGTSYLEYTPPSTIDEIDDVTIFLTEQSRLNNQGSRMVLEVFGSDETTRSVIIGEANPNYREYSGTTGDPAALSFYHLNVSEPEDGTSRIRLVLRLPGGDSMELYAQPRLPDSRDSTLTIDGHAVSDLDISIQIREIDSRRLWRLLLIGGILVALILSVVPGSRLLPAAIIMTGLPMSLILAEICWQFRLDGYWNYFWPDGYVELAHQIRLWLGAEISGDQLMGYLSSYRNGQSWLVPLFVALLSTTGVGYLLSYTLVNYLAGLVLAVAWLALFRRLFPLASPVRQALLVLVIMFHYLHVLTVGTPMTDIMASASVAVFFYFYYPVLAGRAGRQWRNSILPGLVLALSCQTRIALLPLMLTPLATALVLFLLDYRGARSGNRAVSTRYCAAVAAPTLISALFLFVFYLALDLFGTFILAREVATADVFRAGFNPADFFDITLNVCLVGVIATACFWKKAISSPLLVSLWVFILGYLAMLYLGQIITWERYWVPVAGASVLTALAALGYANDQRVFTGGAIALLGAQLYFIFHNNLDLI